MPNVLELIEDRSDNWSKRCHTDPVPVPAAGPPDVPATELCEWGKY